MQDVLGYTVTVTAIVERVEKAGKEWARMTAEPNSPFAHTPEIEKTVRRETKIYEQSVEALDIAALVSVVNGIRGREA